MNEALNLQKAWINQDGFVFHTNTERLYIDLKKTKWIICKFDSILWQFVELYFMPNFCRAAAAWQG